MDGDKLGRASDAGTPAGDADTGFYKLSAASDTSTGAASDNGTDSDADTGFYPTRSFVCSSSTKAKCSAVAVYNPRAQTELPATQG